VDVAVGAPLDAGGVVVGGVVVGVVGGGLVGVVGGGLVGVVGLTTCETTIVTALPRCCWVPPVGFCDSTTPGLFVAGRCCTLTLNPLLASWL
jgi:hypothetical protein